MKHLAFLLLIVIIGCNPISERKQPIPSLYQLSQMDLKLDGKQLAEVYCSNCHLQPKPEQLSKQAWESSVLPDMRWRLGLYLEEDFGRTLPEDSGVPEGVYSKIPYITQENWEKLKQYYLANAPEQPLPQEEKVKPTIGLPDFEINQPRFDFVYSNLTTLVEVDSLGGIWIGHRFRKLFHLDSEYSILDSLSTPVAPVQIRWRSDGLELLSMGLMDPANDTLGVLGKYERADTRWDSTIVLQDLIRPVHMAYGDLNGDGLEDRVVSQFGNHFGKISVFFAVDSGYEEVIIKALPGARKVELIDFDLDGDLDMIGMMTQAQEGIYLWENDGFGQFSEIQLLRFDPLFGGSDFKLVDMNSDGAKDLVIVNGDNADLSPQLKRYHGVRVFINQNKSFEEDWFYPMNGASGVVVEDFDQDGDMDMMAISFFPDPKQTPSEKLVYFKNEGEMEFKPFIADFTFGSNLLIINKGDVDLDGDQDVLIGGFDFDDLYKKPSENWSPLIVLKNKRL